MRGVALFLTKLLTVLVCTAAIAARGDDIEVRDAKLVGVDEGLVLDADFSFALNPRLEEAVTNGVPLYFVVDFEMTRPRWWWLDEKTVSKRLQLRLAYHALSRQFRLSTGLLEQSFGTLQESLHVLQHVRNWVVVDRGVALEDTEYEAAVRMRLDTTLLPKPFQVNALTNREWNLESPWFRFKYHPPPKSHVPAPTRAPASPGGAAQ
jgi:Domain of unknown function (DUF4390)